MGFGKLDTSSLDSILGAVRMAAPVNDNLNTENIESVIDKCSNDLSKIPEEILVDIYRRGHYFGEEHLTEKEFAVFDYVKFTNNHGAKEKADELMEYVQRNSDSGGAYKYPLCPSKVSLVKCYFVKQGSTGCTVDKVKLDNVNIILDVAWTFSKYSHVIMLPHNASEYGLPDELVSGDINSVTKDNYINSPYCLHSARALQYIKARCKTTNVGLVLSIDELNEIINSYTECLKPEFCGDAMRISIGIYQAIVDLAVSCIV